MNINEIINSIIMGNRPDMADPRSQSELPYTDPNMPGSAMASAAPPPSAAPTMPPIPSAPQGVKTPFTNPQSPGEAPKMAQSPPDLANMYIQLMKENQNAQRLDSGLSMIAAGFSKYPENRAALLRGGGGAGGAGGMSLSASDIINFQKQQTEMQNLLIRKNALGGLQKQYNLTPTDVQYLEASGKLDEVIQHKNTQNLIVVEHPDGTKTFNSPVTGKQISQISGEKPPATEITDTPEGKYLINKETGEKIGGLIGGMKPPDTEVVDTPEGKKLINKKTSEQIGMLIGGPKPDDTQVVERPDGSKYVINMKTGQPVSEAAPARKVGDVITTDQENLATENKARVAQGKPELTMSEFKKAAGGGVNINIDPTGTAHPAPETGYDYERYSEGPNVGKVKIGADGRPVVFPIGGSKAAATEQQANIEKAKATEAEQTKLRSKYATVSSVMNAADSAMDILKNAKPYAPAAGLGSSNIFAQFGGSDATNLRAALKTIDSNVAFQQLQAMREASPTGGALGQVSDFENRMLSSVIANLDPNQSPDKVKNNLLRVKAAMVVLAENNFKGNVGAFNNALEAEMARGAKPQQVGKYGVTRVAPEPITP